MGGGSALRLPLPSVCERLQRSSRKPAGRGRRPKYAWVSHWAMHVLWWLGRHCTQPAARPHLPHFNQSPNPPRVQTRPEYRDLKKHVAKGTVAY